MKYIVLPLCVGGGNFWTLFSLLVRSCESSIAIALRVLWFLVAADRKLALDMHVYKHQCNVVS